MIVSSSWLQDDSLKKMIENIPPPLVSFAGSSVAGFFVGMFVRRALSLSQQAKAIQQTIGCSNIGGMLGQTSPSLLP